MGDFDDMIPEYVTESTELLADVESGFLALEEGNADDDTINTIFRAIHSIKGGAGFVGLSKIEHLAHKMEDLLGLIRNKDMEATPPVADALLKALDVLRSQFDNVEDLDSIDTEQAMQNLLVVLEGGTSGETQQEITTNASSPGVSGLPHFDISNYALKNALQQNNVFHLKLDLNKVEARGVSPMELFSELLSMGDILDANLNMPSDGQDYEDIDLSVDVLYSTVLEADLLVPALNLEEGEYRPLSEKDFNLDDGEMESEALAATPAAPVTEAPAAQAPAAVKAAPGSPPASKPKAAPAPAPDPDPEPEGPVDKDYLTFRLDTEVYCVDILRVQEIIGVPHMAKLPRARKDVLGVMNLRGMVVPVFDLRIRFNVPYDPQAAAVVVVMRQDDKIMGGIVDEVRDVLHIRGEQIQPPPLFINPEGDDLMSDPKAFCLEGLSQQKDDIVIILNVDKVYALGETVV